MSMNHTHNTWSWLLTGYEARILQFRRVEEAMIDHEPLEAKRLLEEIRLDTEALLIEVNKVRDAHVDDLMSRQGTTRIGDVEKTVRIDTMMEILGSLGSMHTLYTEALAPLFLRGPKPSPTPAA